MSNVDLGIRLYVFTSSNHELGFFRADSVKAVRALSVGDNVRVLNTTNGKFHTVRIGTTPVVETLRTADNVPFECFTCYGTN